MQLHPSSSGILPTKRPRSTSIPSSPTGSNSSKRAISEDDFLPDRPNLAEMRTEVPGEQSGPGGADVDVGVHSSATVHDVNDVETGEVQKRTEGLHIDEQGGGAPADTAARQKYSELYNTLLESSPPPFYPYDRYALIPTSLAKQLKSAAFEDGSSVELDISPLVQGDGETVFFMEMGIEDSPTGEKRRYLTPNARSERFWRLKAGLAEDEDYAYILEEGWKKLAAGLIASNVSTPALLRYAGSDSRVQLVPPIYTVYVILPAPLDGPAADTAPIKVSCLPETPLPLFLRFLRSALETSGIVKKLSPVRAWHFDPTLALQNNDTNSLIALDKLQVHPALLPAVDGKMVIESASRDGSAGDDTCASKLFQDGDRFVIEVGTKVDQNRGAGLVDWQLDVTAEGHAVVKPEIRMPPVPSAPAPLFSKPGLFSGGSLGIGNSSAASSESSLGISDAFSRFGNAQKREREPVKTRGLVGLVNLGNTCFMNSAVQCLSNTVELNRYFTSSVYKEEINRDNPLGMHGLIADSFGLVVESLWADHPNSPFSPRQLKAYTARFAPQFAGYGQHDTQEFIAFLLDGLHEDLNRIQKKPYIEKPDWKAGGGDKELAELGRECWEGYKKRNDSVIVDLFQGQLMSTLVCPECHKESITMDPFMYLTVPLPIAQNRHFVARFVPKDPEKEAVEINMLIPAYASFMQIKEKIGSLVDADPKHMIAGDLWQGKFYQWWLDGDHNGECKQNDVAIVYDLGVPTVSTRKAVGTIPTDGSITIPVYTCISAEPSKFTRTTDPKPDRNVLAPFFITLSASQATDPIAVREAVARGYTRFLKEDVGGQMWVPAGSGHAVVPMTPAEEGIDEYSDIDPSVGDGTIAEIRIDSSAAEGQTQARVVEVPATRSGANSPVHSLKSAHGNLSSTSLATLASLKSARSSSGKLVPRADLYKIHVADASSAESIGGTGVSFFGKSKPKKDENSGINPLYRGDASNASSTWSSLEARKKAKKDKGGILGRVTSGLFGSGNSDKGDDEDRPGRMGEGSRSRAESPVAGLASSVHSSPQPVVRVGEAIFVEWSSKTYGEYIDERVAHPRQLNIVTDPAIEKDRARKMAGKAIHLEECLDEFSKEETLGQDDLWYCPVCKKHQAATKKLEIYKAPDILVICIKRFGSSRRLSDKLDNLVNFPLEGLDLGKRVGERRVARNLGLSGEEGKAYGMDLDWEDVPTEIEQNGQDGKGNMIYDLYAVDNHFGGLGGGHYTAFCKNREDGQWWNFDDSRVSRARPDDIQSRAAYLLFYRRRTPRPIGGISRVKAEEAESRAASRDVSRAASPAPSADGRAGPSTRHGPSGLHNSATLDEDDQLPWDESDAESTDDEAMPTPIRSEASLPSYSAEVSPSTSAPSVDVSMNVSDTEPDTDADRAEHGDLSEIRLGRAYGQSIGYGNSAWDLGTDTKYTRASDDGATVNFEFGQGNRSASSNLNLDGTIAVDDGLFRSRLARRQEAEEEEDGFDKLQRRSVVLGTVDTMTGEETSTMTTTGPSESTASVRPATEADGMDTEDNELD